jgi:hypothetical protein
MWSISGNSSQSLSSVDFGDSGASTRASASDSQSDNELRSRGSKTKSPRDFSFLIQEPGSKKRRISSSDSSEVAGRWLKVVGPESIQTLRGQLFGREVALILCGESHFDTIDLTRRKGIVHADMGWIMTAPNQAGFNPGEAFATKNDVTLAAAKNWARGIIKKLDKKTDDDYEGSFLVFASLGRMEGSAAIFHPWANRSMDHPLPPGTAVLEWADTDVKARIFNSRRLDTTKMPVSAEEQDALIAERKLDRLGDGIELFDDWLIRNVDSKSVHVEFVLEAPVGAHEVELHVEPGVGAAPASHASVRCMDPDSDEEECNQGVPGNGSFLDTLRRQAIAHFPPERVHCADPRVLGDSEDSNLPKSLQNSFRALVREPPPRCKETLELDAIDHALSQDINDDSSPLPSWEAFLGGAADLLYHAKHVKADFVPFLTDCVESAGALRRFHDALFFGTVPEALAEIKMGDQTRPSACVRSLLYQSPETGASASPRPMGHCSDRRKPVPIRAAPIDRYLKARGFETPRTWVSGLAETLRQSGKESFVSTVREWYWSAVNPMLEDPKNVDTTGDYFAAYLRAAHRDMYDDMHDTTDPVKLRRCTWAPSKKDPKSKECRYNLKDVRIPSLEETFAELKGRSCTPVSSRRERVLGQIFVDVFQLRLVDLAMVLKVANAVAAAPDDKDIAIVLYAGADHTKSITKFWKSMGFSATGLSKKGLVGKDVYKADEPKTLTFPSYLHDMSKLFPIPASLRKRSEEKLMHKRGSEEGKSQRLMRSNKMKRCHKLRARK